ncbi:MAG: 1-acyl-sn-glycerol-3-phosphate acyltransferase [Bacteroidetes bacterium]|nr:1-acyl-sn-glycerol-3-phosphate acyltransferase [Bacteroidota bacterium]
MRYLFRPIQYIYSIYAFIIFLVFMFLLFPLVVICSFFGKIRGGNMVYGICRFWADAATFCWGIRHRNIYESPLDSSKPAVFVFNHISYMDIPVILLSLRKQHFRVLAKAEMAKIPIFGYIYSTATVMVNRANPEKRSQSVRILKSVLKKNISVVIAPEGTFNMTSQPLKEFYDGAFRIAIETQTPIRPLLFLDTYDRLNYKSIFSLSPGKSRTVFLDEIEVSGYGPDDVKELKQKVYNIMEAALVRYRAAWISGIKHDRQ